MALEPLPTVRHPVDHGWIIDGAYICDGCAVLGSHEHRCHRADAGPACACEVCREPTLAELAAFRAEMGC